MNATLSFLDLFSLQLILNNIRSVCVMLFIFAGVCTWSAHIYILVHLNRPWNKRTDSIYNTFLKELIFQMLNKVNLFKFNTNRYCLHLVMHTIKPIYILKNSKDLQIFVCKCTRQSVSDCRDACILLRSC